MRLRDPACLDCQQITSGDCGKHGTFSVNFGCLHCVAKDVQIAALRDELKLKLGKAWATVREQVAQARGEEREWWMKMFYDDSPCIAAGAPRGSCRHDSWRHCLEGATIIRAWT